jgi:hypothetical protein
MWSACGGTESILGQNASDTAVCCPKESSCRFYTSCFWRCEPDWYTHPADAPKDACTAKPPPPPPVVASPVNVTQITAAYSLPGVKCSDVNLDTFAASIKSQALQVVDTSGGVLQDVRATCTDVLPVGRRRVLQTSGSVVIKTVFVIVPKNNTGFSPTASEVLSGNLQVQVIKNSEVTITAIDEASELRRIDIVEVGLRNHCNHANRCNISHCCNCNLINVL